MGDVAWTFILPDNLARADPNRNITAAPDLVREPSRTPVERPVSEVVPVAAARAPRAPMRPAAPREDAPCKETPPPLVAPSHRPCSRVDAATEVLPLDAPRVAPSSDDLTALPAAPLVARVARVANGIDGRREARPLETTEPLPDSAAADPPDRFSRRDILDVAPHHIASHEPERNEAVDIGRESRLHRKNHLRFVLRDIN